MSARAFAIAAILIASAGQAEAFERARAQETDACLWWENRTIRFFVNQSCAKEIQPQADCLDAVEMSCRAWSQDCSDLLLEYGGTTPETEIGFDENHWNQNINLIVWRESSWVDEPTSIALTTITYVPESGEIVDSDIEMNGEDFTFSVERSPVVLADIQNALVHELGHAIGLDHSGDRNASMYKNATMGETLKRDLNQDDVAGLCTIYPAGGDVAECPGASAATSCGCAASGTDAGGVFLVVTTILVRCFQSRRLRNK